MSDDQTDEYLLVAVRKRDALRLMQWWLTTDQDTAPAPVAHICRAVRAKLMQLLRLKEGLGE